MLKIICTFSENDMFKEQLKKYHLYQTNMKLSCCSALDSSSLDVNLALLLRERESNNPTNMDRELLP